MSINALIRMQRSCNQALFRGCQRQERKQWSDAKTLEASSERQERFFTVRVTEHWKRTLRGLVESPSMDIFKITLYMDLGN